MSGKRLWDKGKKLNSEIHTFTVGSDPQIDQEIICWDIIASAAHAIMLAEQDLLTKDDLKKLLPALSEAFDIAEQGGMEIPIELEDCHTTIESFLIEKCGDSGKKIHLGRSRNDQVLVAVRLYLRNSSLKIAEKLLELSSNCLKRAASSYDIQMPGHTHFQQAMPSSVGMWFAAVAESALELAEEASIYAKLVSKNPLGVGSGFGTPLAINRARTTELLAFDETQRNPINTQNSRGKFEVKFLRILSDVSSLIEKYSFDLILFSMQELNYVKIPEDFTTGSSIMPQKRNPDVLELLRANSSKVRAKQFEAEQLIAKLPSNYHRDFQYTKEPVVESNNLVTNLVSIFSAVINGIEFNQDILAKLKTPDVYATYEAFRLVKAGLPFRDAYKQTAEKLEKGLIDVNSLEKDFAQIIGVLEFEAKDSKEKVANLTTSINNELTKLQKLSRDLFSYILLTN